MAFWSKWNVKEWLFCNWKCKGIFSIYEMNFPYMYKKCFPNMECKGIFSIYGMYKKCFLKYGM